MFTKRKIIILSSVLALVTVVLFGFLTADKLLPGSKSPEQEAKTYKQDKPMEKISQSRINPLENKLLYVDQSRSVVKAAADYRSSGSVEEAELLEKIAVQPAVNWLIGPSDEDPTAKRDIEVVKRTSFEASRQKTLPVYQLYAIPNRDACATYSNGGFKNSAEYLSWLDKIVANLRTKAVFLIEADSVGHAIKGDCLSEKETEERYTLLSNIVAKLDSSPKVLASYLDATHTDWFPDPSVLVEPLIKSGVKNADGVSVNVSNFIATDITTEWSRQLVSMLGGESGVVIDTSRNGRGAQDPSITGDERWCNPPGRGLGNAPTTSVDATHVDAYLWVKAPGESDGACFGYPEAGTFVPSLALELARNSL